MGTFVIANLPHFTKQVSHTTRFIGVIATIIAIETDRAELEPPTVRSRFAVCFEKYRRDKETLYGELELHPAQATLGADVSISTPYGVQKVSVPSGTQPGEVITIKGAGAHKLGSTAKGDMKLSIKVVVPKKLSREERANWEQLQQ